MRFILKLVAVTWSGRLYSPRFLAAWDWALARGSAPKRRLLALHGCSPGVSCIDYASRQCVAFALGAPISDVRADAVGRGAGHLGVRQRVRTERSHSSKRCARCRTGLARVVEGVRLARARPGSRLLVSGGAAPGFTPISWGYARIATELGIERSALVLMDRALNTEQESREVFALLGNAPFILVTSANHMPRAMQLMHHAGANPLAAPTGQMVHVQRGNALLGLIPGSERPAQDGGRDARVFGAGSVQFGNRLRLSIAAITMRSNRRRSEYSPVDIGRTVHRGQVHHGCCGRLLATICRRGASALTSTNGATRLYEQPTRSLRPRWSLISFRLHTSQSGRAHRRDCDQTPSCPRSRLFGKARRHSGLATCRASLPSRRVHRRASGMPPIGNGNLAGRRLELVRACRTMCTWRAIISLLAIPRRIIHRAANRVSAAECQMQADNRPVTNLLMLGTHSLDNARL